MEFATVHADDDFVFFIFVCSFTTQEKSVDITIPSHYISIWYAIIMNKVEERTENKT